MIKADITASNIASSYRVPMLLKEKFISASGHNFDGYLVRAHDVSIGDTSFSEFDEASYASSLSTGMDGDEVIAFMDSLSEGG